ncbi:MAG: phosphoribosylformylglycinamidine cyclo-ligase, partial [Dermatophilaceae bacterium]
IVSGIAAGCEKAGTALIGGETAEHPGLMGPDEYDCAGAATGVVEHDEILGPHRVVAGDAVVALASSGLHSNGYSLVRKVFDTAGWALDRQVAEFGRTLGEELLEPTRVYARDLLTLVRTSGVDVHALSHVTGGGLAANLARVLPQGAFARIDRSTWSPPAVFEVVRQVGQVPMADLERTLNMGIGFVVVLPAAQVDRAIAITKAQGIDAWLLGQVSDLEEAPIEAGAPVVRGAKGVDGGSVQLVGTHRQ